MFFLFDWLSLRVLTLVFNVYRVSTWLKKQRETAKKEKKLLL